MKTINIDGKDYTYSEGDKWSVEVGRWEKGSYRGRYSLDTPYQAMRYFNAINIGRGYKKRLSLIQGEKRITVVRQAS
jgi:hypothetical protein